jgi:hypothetical protein
LFYRCTSKRDAATKPGTRWWIFGFTPEALPNNLELLGIEPSKLDALVLSHGHYDHFGWKAGILTGFLRELGDCSAKAEAAVRKSLRICNTQDTLCPVRLGLSRQRTHVFRNYRPVDAKKLFDCELTHSGGRIRRSIVTAPSERGAGCPSVAETFQVREPALSYPRRLLMLNRTVMLTRTVLWAVPIAFDSVIASASADTIGLGCRQRRKA